MLRFCGQSFCHNILGCSVNINSADLFHSSLGSLGILYTISLSDYFYQTPGGWQTGVRHMKTCCVSVHLLIGVYVDVSWTREHIVWPRSNSHEELENVYDILQFKIANIELSISKLLTFTCGCISFGCQYTCISNSLLTFSVKEFVGFFFFNSLSIDLFIIW